MKDIEIGQRYVLSSADETFAIDVIVLEISPSGKRVKVLQVDRQDTDWFPSWRLDASEKLPPLPGQSRFSTP